jgi:hypothetical protein
MRSPVFFTRRGSLSKHDFAKPGLDKNRVVDAAPSILAAASGEGGGTFAGLCATPLRLPPQLPRTADQPAKMATVPLLSLLLLLVLAAAARPAAAEETAGGLCRDGRWLQLLRDGAGGVFADLGDGDEKHISFSPDGAMTITPHGNNQTWQVNAMLSTDFCNATVDFHVPGKPSPPPVKDLTATIFVMAALDDGADKLMVQWTDPSGFLSPPTYPIGAWVLVPPPPQDEVPPAHASTRE